ncbi:unnamed protein product, partial [Polarella glacialis]
MTFDLAFTAGCEGGVAADPATQSAILESITEAASVEPRAGSSSSPLAVNSMVSDALLRSRPEEELGTCVRKVVLLKFNRSDQRFQRALLQRPELEPFRKALDKQGFDVVLPSKAKAFVHPENYEAVLEAIARDKLVLYADHVLVEPELENMVKDVVKGIAKPKAETRALIELSGASSGAQWQSLQRLCRLQIATLLKQECKAEGRIKVPLAAGSPVQRLCLLQIATLLKQECKVEGRIKVPLAAGSPVQRLCLLQIATLLKQECKAEGRIKVPLAAGSPVQCLCLLQIATFPKQDCQVEGCFTVSL